MADPRGFLRHARRDAEHRDVQERLGDHRELVRRVPLPVLREQASRCMACGVPFCTAGCPLGNRIPEWNDAVWRDRPAEALRLLETTNDFPELTGRICPAPCEEACVLNVRGEPVTIETIEKEIADRALAEGWIVARPPETSTGKRVAIVGSGPAGLAAARRLRRVGHDVTVIERADRAGGLLRYGIPDFKLEKSHVDARVAQLEQEGVRFRLGVELGRDVTLDALRAEHDAVILATGASVPRELPIPGRELAGVHRAMDFLVQQNRVNAGDVPRAAIHAGGKHVVVLGGGDTGSDCLGTALRQGARSVTQVELLPRPPSRDELGLAAWPWWPTVFRVSSSQEEGGARAFALRTTRFDGDGHGRLAALEAVHVERDGATLRDVGAPVRIDAQLVLLAMGFVGAEDAPLAGTRATLDARGRISADERDYATAELGVFACGDARRGQSLVVWAIREGRECARAVDAYLRGAESELSSMPASPLEAA